MSVVVPGLVLLCGAAVVAIALTSLSKRPRRRDSWPVYAKPLMSEIEARLYARLVDALPGLEVFPQVQMSRFVEPEASRDHGQVLNRYWRMSCDFVVCRPDMMVIAAIELDDRSHRQRKQRERDLKKDAVLKAAGVEVIRWQASELPSVREIRARVLAN